jgi:hypothetical protein
MDYNARFYSPSLGRFTQPDTVISNLTFSQSWNRFSYAYNNPLYYTDPSGHDPICPDGDCTAWEESQVVWLGGLSEDTIANTHQYQKDGNQRNPNECAVASLSMAATLAFRLQGEDYYVVHYYHVANQMDELPLGFFRIDGNNPDGGGATHPWGLRKAATMMGSEMVETWGLPGFDVEFQANGTTDDLLENLENGNPTIIYGMNGNTPHAVVVAGYDEINDTWSLLDPAVQAPISEWSTEELTSFWVGFDLSGFPVYRDGVMITLDLNQ